MQKSRLSEKESVPKIEGERSSPALERAGFPRTVRRGYDSTGSEYLLSAQTQHPQNGCLLIAMSKEMSGTERQYVPGTEELPASEWTRDIIKTITMALPHPRCRLSRLGVFM